MDPSPVEPNLSQILELAAKGDARAWQRLVTIYTRRVYGLLYRQCHDPELAEEITQDTFVKIVDHLGDYREQGKFEPWLFRIAINRLRDEIRRRKRQAQPLDMTASRSDSPNSWAAAEPNLITGKETGHDDPARQLQQQEEFSRVRQAVAQLPPADQEILLLRHTAGLGFAEIAQTLGEPVGTVLSRAHRALAKLKKILSPEENIEEESRSQNPEFRREPPAAAPET